MGLEMQITFTQTPKTIQKIYKNSNKLPLHTQLKIKLSQNKKELKMAIQNAYKKNWEDICNNISQDTTTASMWKKFNKINKKYQNKKPPPKTLTFTDSNNNYILNQQT